uniref:Uncharacterized protein n=1 Tax=viral metagenome TaxID=1070528 RepID=A0A6M3K7T2_9ZZZZ
MVTREDMDGPDPLDVALAGEGITPERLARALREELEAEDERAFSDSEGVKYSKKMPAWQVRQKARMDAHRLLSHYPAEKVDLGGDLTIEIVKFNAEDDSTTE